MRLRIVLLLIRQTFTTLVGRPGTKLLVVLLNLLMLYALVIASGNFRAQEEVVEDYGQEVRERWENNPDKHPHRMAHYGYVAFRHSYALSFFDHGVDSYVGNAVFLEAHRQNTINFSKASLSTGLLRFGELSGALILQSLLPLVLFFWGFALIAGEREDGKLGLVFAQGMVWAELIIGKAVGLFCTSLLVLLPAMVLTGILLVFNAESGEGQLTWARYAFLLLGYGAYLFTISLLTVWVSAVSKSANLSLLRLIGCWLLFVLVLPKLSQVIGEVVYPATSKVAFDEKVAKDILKLGDSHNPDDPYFQGLKDSVLAVHAVTSTKELPFNYSGFIMREGEKLSTATFRQHESALLDEYEKQLEIIQWMGFLNPYLAIRNTSMSLAGSDFRTYRSFKDQAEVFRYDLAQTMNELQMEHISNNVATSADKSAVLDKHHWRDFPDFKQRPVALSKTIYSELISLLALVFWPIALFALALFSHRSLSIIK